MNGILESAGIDPFYLFVVLFLIQFVLLILLIVLNSRYRKLQRSYSAFMRGRNGKNLEKAIFRKFDELDELSEQVAENKVEIEKIVKKAQSHYQKTGIVKYDAFHEMGGNLSFALTMLDRDNNGWIFNAMHSREGCYTYIKEIVNGQSYIELSEEEQQCLEKAIYQEEYDIRDVKEKKE